MDKKNIVSTKMRKIMLLVITNFIALLPIVLAYPASLPAYDLYTVFVEAVFGGFWLSILGLSIIFFIIMGPVGGMSQFTVLQFCVIFIYAMALGYTNPLILIPLWTLLIGWFVFQVFKYINSGSTA